VLLSLNKKINLDIIQDIKIVPVHIAAKEQEGTGITGIFSIVSGINSNYTGIFIGIIILIALLTYLFILRKNKDSELFLSVTDKLQVAGIFIKEKNKEEAEKIYAGLKNDYGNLSKNEKKKIYSDIELLKNKISILYIQDGVGKLNDIKDKEKLIKLSDEIKRNYENLPDNLKKEIEKDIERLDDAIKNE
jgi:hypothetical protein